MSKIVILNAMLFIILDDTAFELFAMHCGIGSISPSRENPTEKNYRFVVNL